MVQLGFLVYPLSVLGIVQGTCMPAQLWAPSAPTPTPSRAPS